MNLLQLKQALGAGLTFAVSFSTRMELRVEFADHEPTTISKLPPGHYLIIQLPVSPTPESGVVAIAEPRESTRRGQTQKAIGGKAASVPPMGVHEGIGGKPQGAT